MKTKLLIVSAMSLVAVAGCGAAVRDQTMWNADVGKAFGTKQGDMQSCYDNILKTDPKAAGKVAIAFDVETEGGKIQNVTVEKGASTAPEPLQQCVVQSLQGLAVSPPDAKLGQGKWTFEFAPKS